MIELRAGPARALVGPDHGAALAVLETNGLPILRPLAPAREADPFAWAMNILAPFSNRVSVPIMVAGSPVALEQNLPGEAFPIHGDAFQRPWHIVGHAPDSVSLDLPAGAFGPLLYSARLSYGLRPDRLDVRLVLRNRAACVLPFGGGFHPWFPRDGGTRVAFAVAGWWPEDGRHLPATREPAALPSDLQFDRPRPLPDGWINAGFSGWSGAAEIRQGQSGLTIRLTAPGMSTVLLYSPGRESDFFCLEPVSHPVDAHALPGFPGLRFLAPGEDMILSMTMEWTRNDRSPAS
ncbi:MULTISPECIES: aldose 1-epimerase [Tabrizicola]|uniref:aldose 1-epimerase n=1 Tax=Tabrizicola TaxID=1443919 RepID=UPI0014369E9E|nr:MULTISPECIES: aldose 1-epimerase [Paracoccaceae]